MTQPPVRYDLSRRTFCGAVLLGLLICLVATGSIELTGATDRIIAIWPVNAVIISVLLRNPTPRWPLLICGGILGNFAADLLTGGIYVGGVVLDLCHTLEILVAAGITRWMIGDAALDLTRATMLWRIGIICAGVGPAVSATLASAFLNASQGLPFGDVWYTWFLADALGVLTIAPLLLGLQARDAKDLLSAEHLPDLLISVVIALGISVAVFGQGAYPLLFLVFPALILPVFRLGFAGTALICLLMSITAVTLTILGHGPFALMPNSDLKERILMLQAFVAVLNVKALPVAAALQTRDVAQARLNSVLELKTAILDSADFSIIATRPNGLITHFSVGAQKMLGYEAAEMIGNQTVDIIHDPLEIAARAHQLTQELGRPVAAGFDAVIAKTQNGPDESEWTYLRKDGGRVPVSLSVTIMHNEAGAVTGYVGVARDLTTQRELARKLLKTQSDLRHVIDAVPAMVAYWDRGLINHFANSAYVDWFGKSPAQIMTGMHIKDVIGPKLYEANRGYMEAALRGEVQQFEREIVTPSGARRFTQAHYVPDYQDGEVVGFCVLVFDITSLKQSEQALKEAKDVAEHATRAKSDFLAAMSHELRTPLNGVLGFSDLLLTRKFGPLNDKQAEFIGLVKDSGMHLLRLINDVLELSKIEAGKMTVSIEPLSITTLIKVVIAGLRPMAEKAAIHLTEKYKGDLPPIAADATRLSQALINLGSNAIKYNRPGGKVEFSCQLLDEKTVRIRVTDTGLGIPADRQAEVFQSFNRLGAEQRDVEGTGIGLVLTRHLVELMQGSIGFTSVEGEGSVFWVDMPVAQTQACSANPSQRPERELRLPILPEGWTILYIEDNETNRLLMRNYVGLMPHARLIEATNGADGFAMAKSRQPHLILLDVNLPKVNGYQVLRQLRADPATAAIKTMALSANALDRDVAQGLAAGFDKYLAKPLRLRDFLEAIADLAEDRPPDAPLAASGEATAP
jgi:PAS domain S-box-containing protein